MLADGFDDAPDLVTRTPGTIDRAGSQLGQEVMAAENTEWQKAVVLVVAMEEGVFLITMGLDIGSVGVKSDAGRRGIVRLDEKVDKEAGKLLEVGSKGVMAALSLLPGPLQPVQRRLASQRGRGFGRTRVWIAKLGLGQQFERRVETRGAMIDRILLAKRNAGDPLGQQGRELVNDPIWIPVIDETVCYAVKQSNLLSPLAQQQNAGIRRDLAAIESAKDDPGLMIRKPHLQKTL